MQTRTGRFTIGFRRGGSDWQKELDALTAWAGKNGFGAIDVGKEGHDAVAPIVEANLRVGTADLAEWQPMLSPDEAKRADAVARNIEYIRECADAGAKTFFVVMLPEDAARDRAENFGYMVESFAQLVSVLEETGTSIAVEGWPGPGALCCTPEGYRGLFKQIPSPAMGVNYDPSHLVRMGIDPLRFLREFADRVRHVHGKDCEILSERLYELGSEQPATFAERIPFAGTHWRYTIPGHGAVRWIEVCRILQAHDYAGCFCIELEDGNFNGSEEGEKTGLLLGGRYLEGC